MPNSRYRPQLLVARNKSMLALRLRMQGKSFDLIAERCGFLTPQDAQDAVRLQMKNIPMEDVEELREAEMMRLDMLQDIAWTRLRRLVALEKGRAVRTGKSDPLDPIPVILKIMERRAKLRGLDAPERHNVLFTEAQKIADATGQPVADILAAADAIAAEAWGTGVR